MKLKTFNITSFKTFIIFFAISFLSCSNVLNAQEIYDSKFYREFQKYFNYSSEQSGDYFLSLQLVTGANGTIERYLVSNNLDTKMKEKIAFVLSKLDFTSLQPFLLKNSTAVLPIFVIYKSGELSANAKLQDRDMWNFGEVSPDIKYQLLPPIIYRDFKRQGVIN